MSFHDLLRIFSKLKKTFPSSAAKPKPFNASQPFMRTLPLISIEVDQPFTLGGETKDLKNKMKDLAIFTTA